MKYRNILLLFVFLLILSCSKKDEEINNSDHNNKNQQKIDELKKLPINYNRLENFLGASFIPVFSLKTNLDKDIDDEVCIAFKQNNSSNIKIMIFDLQPKNNIMVKAEIKTDIFDSESFIFQARNFFTQKDLTLLIEGKSSDNKSLLYIYGYDFDNDDYKLIKEFIGDYSVIVNYQDIESESGKYSKLKDISVVNSFMGVTSTNIQQKDQYEWSSIKNDFKLTESTKIVYSSSIVDSSIYSSEDNFVNFLKGFWYSDKYENLINTNNPLIEQVDYNNIEFIQFSTNPKELNIKSEDYLNKYSITKVFRIWGGNSPGLRFISMGLAQNKTLREKDIEVYLIGPNRIKVSGPDKFDEKEYIRLKKPLIEYIDDLKEVRIKNEIKNMTGFLIKNFKTNDNIIISFTGNNDFIIQKNNFKANGYYKISYDKSGYIITFLFDDDINSKNNIFKFANYFIKINNDKGYFSIIPAKIKIDKIVINDFKEIVFYKTGEIKG